LDKADTMDGKVERKQALFDDITELPNQKNL
jgi:hypothetical protein